MIERAVVIGPANRAADVAGRLAEGGIAVDVVEPWDPDQVDRDALRVVGRGVDVTWLDPHTGRTLTAGEAAHALAHEAAWEVAASAAGPTLVLEVGAVLAPDLVATLRNVAEVIEGTAWDVLHLDADRRGLAYVVGPAAAARLLADAAPELVPVRARLERAALEAFAVDPPLARPGGDPPPDRLLVDHLRVVEVDPDRWEADLAVALADADPDDVVLAVPAGRATVLAGPAALLAARARRCEPVLVGPGPSLLASAAELAGWLAAGAPDDGATHDVGHEVFHEVARPGDSGTMVIAGRALATATATEPLVVLAEGPAADWLRAQLADDGSRDLARILRYDDAAHPDTAWAEVAPELLVVPFWTPSFCATVIRAAEAVGAFRPDPDDPVPGHEVSLASISPRLFAHLEDDVAVRLLPVLHQVWPYVDYHGLRDAFVIKYALGVQEELRIHHDVAQLSASLKLDADHEGAVLEFPRQGWDNRDVPVGHLVVWPSLVTHPHRATPLTRGVKYGLTIWFELPG